MDLLSICFVGRVSKRLRQGLLLRAFSDGCAFVRCRPSPDIGDLSQKLKEGGFCDGQCTLEVRISFSIVRLSLGSTRSS